MNFARSIVILHIISPCTKIFGYSLLCMDCFTHFHTPSNRGGVQHTHDIYKYWIGINQLAIYKRIFIKNCVCVTHCVCGSNAFDLCASVVYFRLLSTQLLTGSALEFIFFIFFSQFTHHRHNLTCWTRWCCHFASEKFISWLNIYISYGQSMCKF